MLIGTQAVFAPADRAALKAAVGTCTGDGPLMVVLVGVWVKQRTGPAHFLQLQTLRLAIRTV